MEMRTQRVHELLSDATERLEATGSESARLDAEVLLGHVLGVDRSGLAAHPEAVLSTGQLDAYEACLEKPHVRPMDFTGRPLTGMVYVDAAGLGTKRQLAAWVKRGADFAGSLPVK